MTDGPCPLHQERTRPCWECGVARVRAAMTPARRPTTNDDTHGRALARARADRTNAKEKP